MSVAFIRGYDNRSALFDLWEEAFGDTPEFMQEMYGCGYLRPEDVFVLTDHSKLLSALILPEYQLRFQGEDLPVRLLSCVATAPSARNCGYMGQLLSRATELVLKSGSRGICVIPVSEDLFRFYRKFGFHTAFYCTRRVFTAFSSEPQIVMPAIDSDAFYSLYEAKYASEGCVFKSRERFSQAVREYSHPSQPSGFYQIGNGFAFVLRSASMVTVREYAGVSPDVLASSLNRMFALPVTIEDFETENTDPVGMFYTKDPKLNALNTERGYLNCMYN